MGFYQKHVACAISGGVDSAVAAYLLLKKGFKVTGCFMKNWDKQNEVSSNCQSDVDKEDAKYVCNKLKIPFIDIDFTKEYWNQVFSYLLSEYESGFTPNPDILCNKHIKFPLFYNYCKTKLDNVDFIATGHYARVNYDPSKQRYRLLRSVDYLKDQTFFLSQIGQDILSKTLFPIGEFEKPQIKQMANEIGLERIAKRKSSVGICFIGKRDFADFIDQYLPQVTGKIIDIDTNDVIGEHTGIHHYTIGQRISRGIKVTPKQPYFVARKNPKTQDLYAAQGTDHPSLYFNEFYVDKPYWICDDPEEGLDSKTNEIQVLGSNVETKFQHKHKVSPIVNLTRFNELEPKYLVKTLVNLRGVTAGQFTVFYNGDECIGSARISNASKSMFDINLKSNSIVNSDKLLTKNY